MDKFKPNKKKALVSVARQELINQSDKVIDAVSQKWPSATPALLLLQAGFGMRLAYKREVLDQFIEYLMENQDLFTPEMLQRSDFQDALICFMDSYLKLRSDKKRELARKSFMTLVKVLKSHCIRWSVMMIH